MFSLEELYGVNRTEYCEITGVSQVELIRHLEAEVLMLSKNYEVVSTQYRESTLMSPELREQELLLHEIAKRIDSKSQKILTMQRYYSIS
jgi:archaellum component FlaC